MIRTWGRDMQVIILRSLLKPSRARLVGQRLHARALHHLARTSGRSLVEGSFWRVQKRRVYGRSPGVGLRLYTMYTRLVRPPLGNFPPVTIWLHLELDALTSPISAVEKNDFLSPQASKCWQGHKHGRVISKMTRSYSR